MGTMKKRLEAWGEGRKPRINRGVMRSKTRGRRGVRSCGRSH